MPLLLCDLDDTLLDRAAIFRDWAIEFASSRGLDQEFADWLVIEDVAGYRPRAELWASVKERLELTDSIDDLIAGFQNRFARLMRCEATVVTSLERVRAEGWLVAIVTNGDAFQYEKVAHANLASLVDAVCVSGVEGWRKPDPRIFELAAERCGTDLDGGWMIGDNAETDIGGAVASGINSVWLEMGRPWPAHLDFRPTHLANSFFDAVAKILDR